MATRRGPPRYRRLRRQSRTNRIHPSHRYRSHRERYRNPTPGDIPAGRQRQCQPRILPSAATSLKCHRSVPRYSRRRLFHIVSHRVLRQGGPPRRRSAPSRSLSSTRWYLTCRIRQPRALHLRLRQCRSHILPAAARRLIRRQSFARWIHQPSWRRPSRPAPPRCGPQHRRSTGSRCRWHGRLDSRYRRSLCPAPRSIPPYRPRRPSRLPGASTSWPRCGSALLDRMQPMVRWITEWRETQEATDCSAASRRVIPGSHADVAVGYLIWIHGSAALM
mgnify:CR=1 FL=1